MTAEIHPAVEKFNSSSWGEFGQTARTKVNVKAKIKPTGHTSDPAFKSRGSFSAPPQFSRQMKRKHMMSPVWGNLEKTCKHAKYTN